MVALLFGAIAAGCSTQGAYVEADQAEAARETVTTAEQLEAALGAPSVTIPLPEGKILWVYEGVHRTADPTSYVPYLNLLIGTNSKECTRLTVIVDRNSGELSDWQYLTTSATEHWTRTSDKCAKKESD